VNAVVGALRAHDDVPPAGGVGDPGRGDLGGRRWRPGVGAAEQLALLVRRYDLQTRPARRPRTGTP